jgi:hypothetical protein
VCHLRTSNNVEVAVMMMVMHYAQGGHAFKLLGAYCNALFSPRQSCGKPALKGRAQIEVGGIENRLHADGASALDVGQEVVHE